MSQTYVAWVRLVDGRRPRVMARRGSSLATNFGYWREMESPRWVTCHTAIPAHDSSALLAAAGYSANWKVFAAVVE